MDEPKRIISDASGITLDEATNILVKAMNTNKTELTKEQIKLLKRPWWKFWDRWF